MSWRATGVSVGVGVGAVLAWWAWRRAYPKTPIEWEEVGEVSELVIYPLKSGHGVKVTEAEATRYGLAHDLLEDRSFVVTYSSGWTRSDDFTYNVTLTLHGSMVTLRNNEIEQDLHFDLQDVMRAGKVIEITKTLKGYDCGDEASTWLSQVIKDKDKYKKEVVRLAYNGDLNLSRKPECPSITWNYSITCFTYQHFKPSDRIIYADHSPYTLASETSLTDVNAGRVKKVTMDWFRPNLVVRGVQKAYDEDDWAFVRIGGHVVFRRLMPCIKPYFSYVDPATGVRSTSVDDTVLTSFLRIRKQKGPEELEGYWEKNSVFGSRLGIDTCGKVCVGDKVEVARASSNPRWQMFRIEYD